MSAIQHLIKPMTKEQETICTNMIDMVHEYTGHEDEGYALLPDYYPDPKDLEIARLFYGYTIGLNRGVQQACERLLT